MKHIKVSVRIRGEWFAVPCIDAVNQTVGWLGEDALRRYQKLKPSSHVIDKVEQVYEIRKTKGGAILDPDDFITNVLDDNDYVSVGKSLKFVSLLYSN